MSGDFDPAAYVAAKEQEFDPVAYARARGLAPDAHPQDRNPVVSALMGAGQGATFGFGDELYGLAGAVPALWGKEGLSDAYRRNRDIARIRLAEEEASNPKSFHSGEFAGGFAVPLPGLGLAKGASLAARLGMGAAKGGAMGALFGLGSSNADLTKGEGLGALKDMGAGSLFGAGVGAALPLAGSALASTGRAISGPLKVSKAAEYLRSKGINNLTIGQLDPAGALAQLEEASTSVGGVGPSIKAMKEAPRAAWQKVVLGEGLAPGGQLASGAADTQEHLANAFDDFGSHYDAFAGVRVAPVTRQGVVIAPPVAATKTTKAVPNPFAKAISDPSALASKDEAETVRRFLDDQLTLIPTTKSGAAAGTVDAASLLKMRSNIRAAGREAVKRQEFPQARLLSNAEDIVTGALENNLDPKAASALQGLDRQYSRYKVVEDAVARAGDKPEGFSPYNLTQALKGSMGKGSFARGEGGELRQLAKAGREVFDQQIPVTGARALAVGPLSWVTGPAMLGLNVAAQKSPGFQRYLLGQTTLQRPIQALGRTLGPAMNAMEARPYGLISSTMNTDDTSSGRAKTVVDRILESGQLLGSQGMVDAELKRRGPESAMALIETLRQIGPPQ